MEGKRAIVLFLLTIIKMTNPSLNFVKEQSATSIFNSTNNSDLQEYTFKNFEIFIESCPGDDRSTKYATESLNLAFQSSTYVSVSKFCNPFTLFTQQNDSLSNLLVLSHTTIKYQKEITNVNLNDHLLLYQSNHNLAMEIVDSVASSAPWRHVYFYIDRHYGKDIDHLTNSNSKYFVHMMCFVELMSPSDFVQTLASRLVNHHRFIVVMTNDSFALQLMQEANRRGLLDRINHWLVFGDTNFISRIDLRMDSDIYSVRHVGQLKNFMDLIGHYMKENEVSQTSILDIMFKLIKMKITKIVLGEKESVVELPIATWSPTHGLQLISKGFQSFRPNYHRAKLRAVTFETPPYVLIENSPLNNTSKFTGYFVDVLEAVAKFLNFTQVNQTAAEQYIEVKHTTGGDVRLPTIIEYINNRSADIGLFDFSMTLERLPKMDFARVALDTYSLAGLFQRPDHKIIAVQRVGGYFEPLAVGVWLASSLAIFLLVVVYHTAIHINKKLTERAGGVWRHEDATISKSALLIIRTFAAQGTEDNVEGSASGRVIFICLWMFAVLFAAAYSATLMSHLTVNKVHWPFKTLEDLDQNYDYSIGFRIGSGSYFMFKSSPSVMQRRLFERSHDDITHPNVYTFEEGLERAAKDKYVFMVSKRTVDYLTRDKCVYATSNSLTTADIVTVTFQKSSPHVYFISRAFRALNDAGILSRLRQKWWERTEICTKEDQSFISFTLRNVAPAFLILLGGVACSLIVIVIEQWTAGSKNQQKVVRIDSSAWKSKSNDSYYYFHYE